MNASIVSRTLALIPERVSRQQMGSSFNPAASGGAHPERVAHLAQFLEWLGPLREVTKDDLRVFGLLNSYGRPAIAPVDDDDVDLSAELGAESAADDDAVVQSVEPRLEDRFV